jgi:hypothetical protein
MFSLRAKVGLLLRILVAQAWLTSACEPARDLIFTWESGAAPVAGRFADSAGSSAGMGMGMGAAGANDPAGSGGAGGVGGAMPALDPNEVFAWTGTAPLEDSCKPSSFTGNFTCDLTPVVAFGMIEGSLTLTFVGASEARMLSTSDGQLIAFDEGAAMVLTAPVSGTLDCSTHEVAADVARTQTEVLPLDRQLVWLNLKDQPFVTGVLHGTFDPRALTINGDLTLTFEPMSKCVGTFSLRASP